MTPSRWKSGNVRLHPYDTPARRVGMAYAAYALRQQLAGHTPGPAEVTLTITDSNGDSVGQLEMDAADIDRFENAVAELIDKEFGPFERDEVQRLLADYDAQ